ncbi:MAG TPA: substrate-binding domain-containing protein [Candidatus Saccharimonadales bacterium]|nr:substrate-binding domain-containing protein [Candidatus Saccharimonadales bacterium]
MKSLLTLLACIAMAAVGGCSKKQEGSDAAAGGKAFTIAVIPKGTTHEFWKSINAGAFKAREELNAKGVKVDVIWKGPLREDDRDQQIQVVENFTTRRVNGIVLAPLDSQALVRPVESAAEAGVPVVIIDSGLKTDKYVSFVATDNYKGGQLAGDHLGKLLGGKGNVILMRYAVGSASTEEREAGFLEALATKHPGVKIISADQHSGPTRETAYQKSTDLLNRYGNEVNGIFCPCEPPTIAMTKALRDIGKAGGKIKMVGFDAGSQSVLDMKNGDVQGLVVQNPVYMGYKGVMSLYDHLQGQKVEKRIDTGVVLITPENMEKPENQELLHPPLEKYLK